MRWIAWLVVALLAASPARAQSLFGVTASGGAQSPVTVGSNNMPDLLESAINTTGQFAPFSGENATFGLRYGNVNNAIVITKNAGNTQATLTFGPTGVTRVFNGVNQADLENQIEDYLKRNAGNDYADFLRAMNALSVIAISDGNPSATTARMADDSYNRFGFFADESRAQVWKEGKAEEAETQFHVAFSGDFYDIGDFAGEGATVGIESTFNFGRQLGLSIGGFFTYNTLEGADIFHSAFTTGLPVRIVLPEEQRGVLWQVTPFMTAGASGSEDIAAGGLILGGGVTNHVGWRISPRFTLAMANQIAFYRGRPLEWEDNDGLDWEIDPGVDQEILKNGLRASLGLDDRWSLYGGISYSNFLDDASIDDWWTPEVGATFTKPDGSGFRIGVGGGFADDYSAFGARFILKLAF